MPLGLLRLNERKQRPNVNINFIKPLEGPDKDVAQDFLERIAAQCYPVMQKDYISVMTLEEYEPNPEFLGRNFNAGEVIQLVLKDKGGRWLSFKFVQMVMMHELAHCKQMNHSRFFWAERNKYANHMEELWAKKYLGEGLWGRGQDLSNGRYVHDHMPDQVQIPEHLCGGTYRRARGRKRKRGQNTDGEKPKETYAERQQKRIARKFGKHGDGNAVGEDDMVRGGLERGKRHQGKPKVANSKRGRELRASAALARFEHAKKAVKEETPELVDDDDSETESDGWGDDSDADLNARSSNGKSKNVKDQHGHDMVRVCGDEGEDDEGARNEMDDLRLLDSHSGKARPASNAETTSPEPATSKPSEPFHEDSETESEPEVAQDQSIDQPYLGECGDKVNIAEDHDVLQDESASLTMPGARTPAKAPHEAPTAAGDISKERSTACPVCSLENEPDSPICLACSNVLKPSLMPNHWLCNREACKGTSYINAADFGRCGLCGGQKPVATVSKSDSGRAVGVIGADVLRWD